ncbi:TPA: hypothetical protein EYP37_08795 [Candidatus Poribacteria bacterium]|nr:hypothetical protein [Candidatus Poribacteria bacterium]
MMELEELKKQEKEFFALRDRIMAEAERRGITMRILGAIAFRTHCPTFKHIGYQAGRALSDIDFAAYREEVKEIERLFLDLGYEQAEMVKRLFGTQRRIFYDRERGIHSDVFLDKLRFCHDINLRGRLEIDYPTIPLVDLLLEKMQIVQLTEKDVIDTIMLLREHGIGDSDEETINAGYLASLCSRDWGLWRTVIMNLEKVEGFLSAYDFLTAEDRADVASKIRGLLRRIEDEPKSLKWRMRARVGDKVQWYRDVDEVAR